MSFDVHGEVRHAHQGILERREVRRRPSAKALEQPGSFDLGDHRLRFRARDGAASQGDIVVDLDHHAATAEQEHRAQLRVRRHANDNFYTFSRWNEIVSRPLKMLSTLSIMDKGDDMKVTSTEF